MAGRGLALATALLLVAGCGPRSSGGASASADQAGAAPVTEAANPTLSAADNASSDFCQLRASGPPDLIAFLNAVETCDGLSSVGDRAQARCVNLGANETRLRSRYVGDGAVMAVLNRARIRPWPACPALPQPAVEDAPSADEPATDTEATTTPAADDP